MIDVMDVFGTSLLIVGDDPLLVQRSVNRRVAAARAQHPEAELRELSGQDMQGARFAEAVGGSLFSAYSIVVVTEAAVAMSDAVLHEVVDAAKDPGEALCLTIVHKGVGGKAVLDALGKARVTRENLTPPKVWELPRFVREEAGRLGMEVDEKAAQTLVDALGNNLLALVSALTQLADDWDGARLTADMVGRYFEGRVEVTGFAIADDVIFGRLSEALAKLRWAFDAGVTPPTITAALANGLRSLGKYLDARHAEGSPGQIASQVGVPEWKLKTLAAQASGWTPGALAQAVKIVAAADADTKGGAVDAQFAVEKALIDLDYAHQIL
ncbi:MAG: DNA polymerase III subunit delta [Propionibacteriaceae bacterium]|nr:DNA polymerase III subunit delta [Propionibacteriaceae bacterium]